MAKNTLMQTNKPPSIHINKDLQQQVYVTVSKVPGSQDLDQDFVEDVWIETRVHCIEQGTYRQAFPQSIAWSYLELLVAG